MSTESARATWFVRGRVQGVGFRWWTRSRALELGLVGHARNMSDGRVEVVAQGHPGDLDRLGELLRQPATERDRTAHGSPERQRPGEVTAVVRQDSPVRDGVHGFVEK